LLDIRKELQMSKIVVNNNLTLDGVMQASGRPDEDLRGSKRWSGGNPPPSRTITVPPPAAVDPRRR
jgi:hypothetical protein